MKKSVGIKAILYNQNWLDKKVCKNPKLKMPMLF